MDSEVNNDIPHTSPHAILLPRLNEDVLRHIARFLDFQSLRHFRLVSHEWNDVSLPILMKRGTYNLTCHANEECADLYGGANHYSSWKISHSVYESTDLLHDNQMWQNLSSLTVHQLVPLTSEFRHWVCETMESRCPNLQEIHFIFESAVDSSEAAGEAEAVSEVESDRERTIAGLQNETFPMISNLTNLTSIKLDGICDKTSAFFTLNLLQACINLRHCHLYFYPMGQKIIVFRVFEYLQQNPTLLKNLQTFAFNIGRYCENKYEEEVLFCVVTHEMYFEYKSFLELKESLLLPFQCSQNLTKLFWDLPFHLDDQLLPGVLTPSIASSLVQLCLHGSVENLGERLVTTIPINISFPNFPRLRALKLGLLACLSLSVPELVDSAPNLYVLELKGLKESLFEHIKNDMSWFGRLSDHPSSSNLKHSQLSLFCTDISIYDSNILQEISGKFPNLVELRLGSVWDVGLELFLRIVKLNHSKLQRLSWVSNETERLSLGELIDHLDKVPRLLPKLSSYSLGLDKSSDGIRWPKSELDFQKLTRILFYPPSMSNSSSLVINLLMKCLSCQCKPKTQSVRDLICKQCYLQKFITRHNLPIRIHSAKEIEEMEEKYKWDHRFASFWIYK
jgi:hypothetical protein